MSTKWFETSYNVDSKKFSGNSSIFQDFFNTNKVKKLPTTYTYTEKFKFI